MAINAKKSCCLRIGPRCNVDCANILTHDGCSLQWVAELRYLGIFIARARTFRCSLNYAKRSFFGAVNGLFGQEHSYRNRSRVSCAHYVEGIHRPKYYTVTLKSRLRVRHCNYSSNLYHLRVI